MELTDLTRIVSMGESIELEFKRSTAQLRAGMESICGMLNAVGRARLLIGVSDSGELIGQQVSDKTLREVARRRGLSNPWSRYGRTPYPLASIGTS